MKAIFEKTRMSVKRTGFALVELLVAISIIVILSTVLVVHQGAFDDTIHLTNTAHEVVLVIQRAQQYSTSIVGGHSFGVQLQENGNQIVFYRNTNANLQFEHGTDIIEETFRLPRRATIGSITATGGGSASLVSIAFRRPNPEPLFFSGNSPWTVGSNNVRIQLRSGTHSRTIIIAPTGRIFLES